MITVAGCGRMGEPMLDALRAAGFDTRGFDVRPKSHDSITDEVEGLVDKTETLISVVRDIAQTEEVLFDVQAFAHGQHLSRVIICSTLSPRYVKKLRDRMPAHIALIDAPMSGAQIAAEEARLSFMLGGSPADLDAAQPLFDAMGAHFHRMGDFGAGMQAKVLNNLLAASNTAMTRLVLDWADEAGLDENKLLALIHTSSGQNWFASGFNDIEFARDGMAEDNSIGILVKDVASALDAAPQTADVGLPQQVQTAIRALKPRPV
ncbi:3-hydroxyisobutyrate dehydrogenase-like beta-hydroxyacid dehydrogenase [Sulfitobacter noctilucicola]|uniref:3-hydroxyisobutyrate dehydrogenase-like beta-hydroxyacid dehydrogenase n=2 Tax=Sulfitobacter noctilucicola TaxID=1342301 RepID=A0A7W6M9S6_9RHOB|nr:3-hydroxyisobutyrate dehydrogenase-like beta-hydroxyacid dehydrogenase [Sulfitobacter noctilucicola]